MSSTLLENPRIRVPAKPAHDHGAETVRDRVDAENAALIEAFSPNALKTGPIDWVVVGFMIAMHAGCIAAPFFFSWTALGVCIFLHWLTCSIGICFGYHRYLSHKSMKLKRPGEFFILACGAISGEGPPLTWTANHRLHHQKSDHEGDPHSPLIGPWWSHILWLFIKRKPKDQEILIRRYVPELAERPLLQYFERTYAHWLFGVGIVLLAVGWATVGWKFGLSLLLWGMCVRMTFAYHSTWFVNSATHLWGYRNYQTRDQSRNLWWVAMVAYGEGWHNNHHAHPSVAPAGHRWWEIDMTWWAIRFMRLIGQAYDVRDRIPTPTEACEG